jgi:hypothetical protein
MDEAEEPANLNSMMVFKEKINDTQIFGVF